MRAALLLFLLALTAPAFGAGPSLEIRADDTVILKSGEKLVGEIKQESEREVRIQLQGGVIRTEPMANVEKILRRQGIKDAFDNAFKDCAGRKDPVAFRELALEVLDINPGMVDEAIRALEAARELKADYGPGRLMLGQLYLKRGRCGDAIKEAQAAAESLPQEAAAGVLLGTALVRQGKVKEAKDALEKALKLKLSDADRVGAAGALAEAGDTDRAQELLKDLVEGDPAAQLASGIACLRAGKLADAAALLTRAVEKLPGEDEPHLALAAVFYLQGETDKAARELNATSNLRDPRGLALKGLLALRRGDLPGADGALKDALLLDVDNGRTAAAKAVLEVARGNLEEAVKVLLAVLEPRGGEARPAAADAGVHYLLGWILYRKGDAELAQKKPDEALKSFAASLAAYTRAAELAPGWPDARLGAGAAALAGRNFRSAAEHFEFAATKLANDSAAAHVGLGLSYLGLVGREDEADKELRRALALDPRCIHAHLGLGFLANRQRRETEAIAAFERAIGLDGSNAYAADALNKLRSGRGEEVQYFPFDGAALPPGWATEQLYGVQVTAADGRVLLAGKQKRTAMRDTRFLLRLEAAKFSRLDLDVECAPSGGLVAGVFLGGGSGDLELAMIETGRLAWRKRDRGGWSPFEEAGDWPKGEAGAPGKVRLAIELVSLDRGAFRLYAAGRPVTEKEIIVDTLARATGFSVGAFCRAQLEEDVRVGLDNACLVTKKPKGDEK